MAKLDDYYFNKPGAVPFNWESKPGVPKPHHTPTHDHNRSSLKPPPNLGSTRSFRSVSHLRPERHRAEPVVVSSSSGCFLSPLFRRKWGKKSKKVAHKASPEYEPFKTHSTRKSSLWETSTCSSSFSSYRSSPQPVRGPEWAGFGLF